MTPHVPGFALHALLGEGGFGQVWRATAADGATVAIKVLHFELVQSADALVRFQRELAAIERLAHPNVVRGLGRGTLADGRPYLVLEYLDGPSLREVIRDRGALDPADMLAIFEPVCDALEAAHALGLVHRDLKASNIVLVEGTRPVVLDFGLVKLLDQPGPGLSSSRNLLGTPTAMAPEQLRGQPVDARTDVYALGLLAYHMLTGQPAFTTGTGAMKSYLQLHGPRPRPSSKVDIDPAIDRPIVRALSPLPEDRHASAAELLDALRTVIRGGGPRESAPALAPRAPAAPDPAPPPADVELEVVALYAEASRALVARVHEVAVAAGMTVAIAAPDSILAVAPRDRVAVSWLRGELADVARHARIAIGTSRAAFAAGSVDGPALDVEAWAPYPLGDGMWIAPDLA